MSGKKKSWLDYQIEQKPEEELHELSAKIDNRLFGIQDDDPEKFSLISVRELADEAEELAKNWGKMQGISTGLISVDYNLRGLVGGELVVLAGETSHGKTTLAVNIAANVAKQRIPVLFITLENTQAQLTARVLKVLGDNKTALYSLPFYMQKKDELNWRSIDELVARAKDDGIRLVVIDHLHYFTREIDNVAEDLGRITKELKKNAIRHNVPIVLISHVRKKDNSKKPEMSNDALRGSSFIAQDADVVMFVHKVSDTRVAVKTTKNRNRGFDFDNDTVYLKFTDGAVLTDTEEVSDDAFEDLK